MNKKILVIHPAYNRSGSVTFQHFLKSLEVNILAKPVKNQASTIWFRLFKEHLIEDKYEIKKKEYDYYKLKNDFKDYLKSFFNNQKKISVFSDEGLLGPHGSKGNNNLNVFKEIIDEIENELNIKIVIKFILSIRKQHGRILSVYHSNQENSGRMSLEDFFKKIIQSDYYKNLYDYTWLVKKINKIFNSEILILPLELLRKDEKKYIDKLCKFMDLEINIEEKLIHLNKDKPMHSNKNYIIKDGKKKYFVRNKHFSKIFYLALVIHNWLKKIEIYKKNSKNNFLLKFFYNIISPKEKRVLIEQNLDLFQNEIKDLYKDSNLELEKITDVNLKELGYY